MHSIARHAPYAAKILNKRRIKWLVYRTRPGVIFLGPGLPGFLGRGLRVYNVFGFFHLVWCYSIIRRSIPQNFEEYVVTSPRWITRCSWEGKKRKEFCAQHVQIFSSWSSYSIFFKTLKYTSSENIVSISHVIFVNNQNKCPILDFLNFRIGCQT